MSALDFAVCYCGIQLLGHGKLMPSALGVMLYGVTVFQMLDCFNLL